MQIKYFDFPIPQDSIAYYPWWCRTQGDSTKMIVLNRETGEIQDKKVEDLLTILHPKDALVCNNTKANPTAYHGSAIKRDQNKNKKHEAIQLLLTRRIKDNLFEFLIFPSRLLREGTQVTIGKAVFYIIDSTVNKGKVLSTSMDLQFVEKELEKNRSSVLPQYIKRKSEQGDVATLNHHLATEEGSVAPASANLLIPMKLYMQMTLNGFTLPSITNHINIGCFTDHLNKDIKKCYPESQHSIVDQSNANLLTQCKGRIISVGINTLKTLEESVNFKGVYRPHDKYISPHLIPEEYTFKGSQGLLTGLHLPKSQYLVSATAFAGYENMMNAYKHAIDNDYKFGMYGDAMLII